MPTQGNAAIWGHCFRRDALNEIGEAEQTGRKSALGAQKRKTYGYERTLPSVRRSFARCLLHVARIEENGD